MFWLFLSWYKVHCYIFYFTQCILSSYLFVIPPQLEGAGKHVEIMAVLISSNKNMPATEPFTHVEPKAAAYCQIVQTELFINFLHLEYQVHILSLLDECDFASFRLHIPSCWINTFGNIPYFQACQLRSGRMMLPEVISAVKFRTQVFKGYWPCLIVGFFLWNVLTVVTLIPD